jgi:D-glycero-alpha-D-manno-heptose-7-phosphate kinase
MIITKTPYRLSLFGGGTDYNSWYEEHGGLVIGSAFAKYCYLTVRKLPPFFEHRSRIVYSKIESVLENREIQHPSVRGCLEFLDINDGLEIHHDGDLPARSGIGSSSTFTAGLLLALHVLKGQMPTKLRLAQEAIKVEQDVLKENVGIQDQVFASYGGLQLIDMGPGNTFKVSPLILSADYKLSLEKHIMLGFTGFTRTSSDIAGSHIKNIKNGNSASRLVEIHSIAKEALRKFNALADFNEVGDLIHQTWLLKRSLSERVSNDIIDQIYNEAVKAGAYGGRLLGAGGGGFLFFLAPPERHQEIREALAGVVKVWIPFSFDTSGATVLLHTED